MLYRFLFPSLVNFLGAYSLYITLFRPRIFAPNQYSRFSMEVDSRIEPKRLVRYCPNTFRLASELEPQEILSFIMLEAMCRNSSEEKNRLIANFKPAIVLTTALSNFSTNEIVDCIWSLGMLHSRLMSDSLLNFNEVASLRQSNVLLCTKAILTLYERSTNDNSDTLLLSRSAAKLTYGIMKLNISWRDLIDNNVDGMISSLLLKSIPNMSSQGVSNVLYSLGRMRMSCSPNKRETIEQLVKSLLIQLRAVSTSLSFKGQAISNSLWGMYLLGLKWNRLPSTIKSAIFGAISRECFRMSPQSVGNTLFALGKMGLTVDQLSEQMLMTVEIAVRKSASSMRNNDVLQVLQGLSLLQFNWVQHLSSDTRERLSIAVYNKAMKWHEDASSTSSPLPPHTPPSSSSSSSSSSSPSSFSSSPSPSPPSPSSFPHSSSSSLQQSTSHPLSSTSSTGRERAVEVAILLHSLSRMQVRWEDVGPVYRTAIMLGISSATNTATSSGTGKEAEESHQSSEDRDNDEVYEGAEVESIPGGRRLGESDYLDELKRLEGMALNATALTSGENDGNEEPDSFDEQLKSQFRSRRKQRRKTTAAVKSTSSTLPESGPSTLTVAEEGAWEIEDERSTVTEGDREASLVRSIVIILHSLVAMKFDPRRSYSYTYLEDTESLMPPPPQFPLKEREVLQSLLLSLQSSSSSALNQQDLAMVLYSLGSLGLDWSRDLSATLRGKLLSTIDRTLHLGTDYWRQLAAVDASQVLANSMFGLAAMGVRWTDLTRQIQTLLVQRTKEVLLSEGEVIPFNRLVSFLSSAARIFPSISDKNIHSQKLVPCDDAFRHAVLVASARSIYCYEQIMDGTQRSIGSFDFVAFSSSGVAVKDIALLLNVIAKIGIDEKMLRRYSILRIRAPNNSRYHISLNNSEAISLGQGEGVMSGKVFNLSRLLLVNHSEDVLSQKGLWRFNHGLYQAIPLSSGNTSSESVGRVFSEPLLARFFKLIHYSLRSGANLQGVMLLLQSLAKMNVRWMNVPVEVRRDLLRALLREGVRGEGGAAQATAIICHSLGKLNCKWADMQLDLEGADCDSYEDGRDGGRDAGGVHYVMQRLLHENIDRMDCQNLANTLSGIRDMDALLLQPSVSIKNELVPLSAQTVEALLSAVVCKLSGESGKGSSEDGEGFSIDGLVAVCLGIAYLDSVRLSRGGLGWRAAPRELLLRAVSRHIKNSDRDLSAMQSAQLRLGLERLGWFHYLGAKEKSALLL